MVSAVMPPPPPLAVVICTSEAVAEVVMRIWGTAAAVSGCRVSAGGWVWWRRADTGGGAIGCGVIEYWCVGVTWRSDSTYRNLPLLLLLLPGSGAGAA